MLLAEEAASPISAATTSFNNFEYCASGGVRSFVRVGVVLVVNVDTEVVADTDVAVDVDTDVEVDARGWVCSGSGSSRSLRMDTFGDKRVLYC